MPGLIECCEKYFGSKDLYEILKIPSSATDKEGKKHAVRKAYLRLSLLVHPDRVDEEHKINATEKFKVLGKIHTIISNSEKRAIYNTTGSWDDEYDELEDEMDWSEYWQIVCKEISIEDIINYEKKYKGSEEELADLKRAYMDYKGDMDYIFDAVPFTNVDEEPRLRELIQGLIDKKEVPKYDAFVNETQRKRERRKRKYKRKQLRFESKLNQKRKKCSKEINVEGELNDGLEKALVKHKKHREGNSSFEHLGVKYASPRKRMKKSDVTCKAKKSTN